jgi:hypothetical protein
VAATPASSSGVSEFKCWSAILSEFSQFPPCLQANSGTVPRIRPRSTLLRPFHSITH